MKWSGSDEVEQEQPEVKKTALNQETEETVDSESNTGSQATGPIQTHWVPSCQLLLCLQG